MGGEQAVVVPGLLHEVAGAAAHGFDGEIHIAPGCHDDDRHGIALVFEVGQEVHAFLAGRGVARVVEVGEDEVEVIGAGGTEQRLRRVRGDGLPALSLEQEPEGFEDVGLVVADQDAVGLSLSVGGSRSVHRGHPHSN